MVIDIGAGSGLLSMMAARAGADVVVAVEQSSHMCDVAEKTIAANGLSSQCLVLQRDSRRMFATTSDGLRAGRKPDGEAPELERQADILVFEVFDSGLIGEGALHLTVLAKHRLLLPHARIIPAAARVFCQPVEFRVARCCGVDVQQLNRYNWRADYEGVNMDANREQWSALADPVQIFDFDFSDIDANSVPVSVSFDARVTQAGVFNAVSLWFELQLDEHEMLTTSPDGKGGTWQNAVYFVDELRVAPGDQLRIEASHDTYSITVTVRLPAPRASRPLAAIAPPSDANAAGARGAGSRHHSDRGASLRPSLEARPRHVGGRQFTGHQEHRAISHRAPRCGAGCNGDGEPAGRPRHGGRCSLSLLHAHVFLRSRTSASDHDVRGGDAARPAWPGAAPRAAAVCNFLVFQTKAAQRAISHTSSGKRVSASAAPAAVNQCSAIELNADTGNVRAVCNAVSAHASVRSVLQEPSGASLRCTHAPVTSGCSWRSADASRLRWPAGRRSSRSAYSPNELPSSATRCNARRRTHAASTSSYRNCSQCGM